jgi:uncharacterized SAM-dependent methyltransferase
MEERTVIIMGAVETPDSDTRAKHVMANINWALEADFDSRVTRYGRGYCATETREQMYAFGVEWSEKLNRHWDDLFEVVASQFSVSKSRIWRC